jgi:hypothetical protein
MVDDDLKQIIYLGIINNYELRKLNSTKNTDDKNLQDLGYPLSALIIAKDQQRDQSQIQHQQQIQSISLKLSTERKL